MHSTTAVTRIRDESSSRTKSINQSNSSKKSCSTTPRSSDAKSNPVSLDDEFVRPTHRPLPSSSSSLPTDTQFMKKALSCSNIRGSSSRPVGPSHVGVRGPTSSHQLGLKYPGSVNKISVPSKKSDLTASEPRFRTTGPGNGSGAGSTNGTNFKSPGPHKTHLTSNLLSRIEKEKQYEAQISRLIKIAESRKLMIKKLNFEVQRLKKEAAEALILADEAKSESDHLKTQSATSNHMDSSCPQKDADHTGSLSGCPKSKDSDTLVMPNRAALCTSPADSLSTSETAPSLTVGSGSMFSELNDLAIPSSFRTDGLGLHHFLGPKEEAFADLEQSNRDVPMCSLRDRLLQMEEVNCSKTEELQATQQELWDLQRSLDEAQTETRSLAFQRDILRQALSTETAKVKHCRFQIEQLKHLLSTDRYLQTPESREQYFRELYYSVEREKQVLLDELAEATTDTVFQQCSILIEKASLLQDYYDALKIDYGDLEKAYEISQHELTMYKNQASAPPPPPPGPSAVVGSLQSRRGSDLMGPESDSSSGDFGLGAEPGRLEMGDLTLDVQNLKEALAFERMERERETTEWRHHESDLLVAVQVANKIRTEAEMETSRLVDENAALKRQIDKLSEEIGRLNSEVVAAREESLLANRTSVHKESTPDTNAQPDLGRKSDPVPDRAPCCDLSPMPNPSFLSTQSSSSVNPCRLTSSCASSVMAESIFPSRSTVLHSAQLHSSTTINTPSGSCAAHGSPGAPGRPSALTNGPKVRNVIQSIENRIKAAHHQKFGISTKPDQHLLYTSPTFRAQSNKTKPDSRLYLCKPSDSIVDDTKSLVVVQPSSAPGGPDTSSSSRAVHYSNVNGGGGGGSSNGKSKDLSSTLEAPHSIISSPFVDSAKHPGKPNGIKKRYSDLGCPYSHVTSLPTSDTNTPTKFSLGSNTSSETTKPAKRSYSPPCCPKQPAADTSSLQDLIGSDKVCDASMDPGKGLNRFTTPNALVKSNPNMETSPNSDSSFNHDPPVPDMDSSPSSTPTNAGGPNTLTGPTPVPPSSAAATTNPASGKWPDPLLNLVRRTGARSKYNALLSWCQSRVKNYPGVEVTNLSSSWNNGLALCALLHSFVPSKIPWNELVTPNGLPVDKRFCFEVAFHAAESDGVSTTLGLQEMLSTDRPNWNDVMTYVTAIYQRYDANSAAIPGMPSA